MRVVEALGGNALLRRGEPAEAETQRRNVEHAAAALAAIASAGHELVVTHGNGPQVGLLALQSEAYRQVPSYPLDVLGAESEGMIGYILDQELANALPERHVATLLTQVVVDPGDPAFATPTKPIGPVYDAEQAQSLANARGWSIAPDGDAYRRVVPSPEPLRVVELSTIRLLVDAGVLVICAGGGGVPVFERDGALAGVEAVIDKDLAAALLAIGLDADALLLLTDVPGVHRGWGTDHAELIGEASLAELRSMGLPAGSMGPKVEAVCRFAERTGGMAAICELERAAAALDGRAGTRVSTGKPAASAVPATG
jgi:carbamate kinase